MQNKKNLSSRDFFCAETETYKVRCTLSCKKSSFRLLFFYVHVQVTLPDTTNDTQIALSKQNACMASFSQMK